MWSLVAYVIVIVFSQFCLTIGVYMGGLISGLPAMVLSKSGSIPLLIGGVTGSLASCTFGYFIFTWLVGPDSFNTSPFIAATVPLMIPIYNDYRKAVELENLQSQSPPRVAEEMRKDGSMKYMVIGEVLGIICGALIYLN